MKSMPWRNFMARVGTLSAAAIFRGAGQASARTSTSWTGGEAQNPTFPLSRSPRDGYVLIFDFPVLSHQLAEIRPA
jgi:hypothetical protein